MTASSKRLTRSRDDRMLSGVCAGIAEYMGLDPTVVRLLWAVVTILSFGFGILAYVAALVLMPEPPPADAPHEAGDVGQSLDVRAWSEAQQAGGGATEADADTS